MTPHLTALREFLDGTGSAALVEIEEAHGSTPREPGAWMVVSAQAILATIGGGQLEFLAIAKAREMLAAGTWQERLDLPLGPKIGQCCGGRVAISVRRIDRGLRAELETRAVGQDRLRPHVLIFGGGHVGHALAAALDLLPVQAELIDTRADMLEGLPPGTRTRLTAMPEACVRAAPDGTAYVVVTHDHALDFLIVAEALQRPDAAYVGMIGSRTKKATFKSWFMGNGGDEQALARLVSPIGGQYVRDKRPQVIAALTAAEIIASFERIRQAGTSAPEGGVNPELP